MTVEQFLTKYDNKETFTAEELRNLDRYGFEDDLNDTIHLIQTVYGENRRWSRMREDYYEINGRYFCFYCDEGLTENQENEYWEQPEEVIKHQYEKTIIVTEWKRI